MRRRLQSVDQHLPGAPAFLAVKLVRVDDHDSIAPVQRDVLRPVTVRQAHEFTETRLRVLQAPTAALRLGGCGGPLRSFSGHADQISTA